MWPMDWVAAAVDDQLWHDCLRFSAMAARISSCWHTAEAGETAQIQIWSSQTKVFRKSS